MNCPKCNGEMMQGYLGSGYPIYWTQRKNPMMVDRPGEVLFKRKGFLFSARVTAHHCPACKLILTEYTENDIRL